MLMLECKEQHNDYINVPDHSHLQWLYGVLKVDNNISEKP